jgi:drug/metabolite transporter (DMT)-like permease
LPPTAFCLVLFAAIGHSSWNFLAKRAAHCKHLPWFSSLGSSVLLLPVSFWILNETHWAISPRGIACLVATGILHLFYTECLLRGYRVGDLSVVYPLARGTGPLLTFVGAILALGERPSRVAVLGVLLVSCGIFVLSMPVSSASGRRERRGVVWGLLTGLIIAGYTLTDAYSVKVLALSPILVDFAGNLFRAFALAPRAWLQRGVVTELRQYWRESLGVTVLTPLAYIFVLFAMKLAPVSRIAPVREMSMIFGAFLGTMLLREGHVVRRALAATLIALGVVALTLG